RLLQLRRLSVLWPECRANRRNGHNHAGYHRRSCHLRRIDGRDQLESVDLGSWHTVVQLACADRRARRRWNCQSRHRYRRLERLDQDGLCRRGRASSWPYFWFLRCRGFLCGGLRLRSTIFLASSNSSPPRLIPSATAATTRRRRWESSPCYSFRTASSAANFTSPFGSCCMTLLCRVEIKSDRVEITLSRCRL